MVLVYAQTTANSSKEKGATAKQEADSEARTVTTFQSMRIHTPKNPMTDKAITEARTPLNYSDRHDIEEQTQKLHIVQAIS